MSATRDCPVLVVLGGEAGRRPPRLGPVEERMVVRYVDSAGLPAAIHDADALLLWDFFSTALADVWDRQTRLRWVHVAAAGVDKLLFPALVQSEVVVTNARGVFDRPIAEFVLAVILAHAKELHASRDLQRAHVWRHRETQRVQHTNAMIIGTGGIGRETARILRAVGMRVRGVGRTTRSNDPDFGQLVDSDRLALHVPWADYLVNAAPLTDRTRGLLDAHVFAAMKPTSYLVNVGRGASLVEHDLLAALEEGRIAGATLDVFEQEPLPGDHPLWDAPGVTVSPHMSGDVVGWLDTLTEQFLDNALRWLDGQPLLNRVDKALGYVPASERGSGPHD